LLLVGAILPVAVAAVPAPRAAAGDPPALKIGMPETMFSGLPAGVVQAASRPFQSMFEKQTGLKGEVVVAKDYADLADQLRGGKIDVGVFHGFEFAWVKHHPELIPLLVTVPAGKLQACLVVNVESTAKGPTDLKGECVAIPPSTKAHCRLYLERLKVALPEGRCGLAKVDGNSVEDALDAVCKGTCPAALVEASALASYRRDKPGVGAQLKVLSESEPFPSAVVVYRKDVFDTTTAARVRGGLIKGVETPPGQLLTSLWRLKGFAELGPGYQADLEKVLKAYPAPKK
jgi:ABC-type phosphate/phosphonate transport system substrate-binding protein